MISRRSFVASLLPASASFAAVAGRPLLRVQRAQRLNAPYTDMPPSIARLTSMRADAHPITGSERLARVERARQLMAAGKLDALILTGGTSLVYFTGIRWGGGERLSACLVPQKGEPLFVCPAFEEDRLHEQLSRGPFGARNVDVRTWQEDESPCALVAQALK